MTLPSINNTLKCSSNVYVSGSFIYKLRGIDPDGDTLTFGVKEQLGHDILRIESFGVNEANVYLKKELDREVRENPHVVLLLYSD